MKECENQAEILPSCIDLVDRVLLTTMVGTGGTTRQAISRRRPFDQVSGSVTAKYVL